MRGKSRGRPSSKKTLSMNGVSTETIVICVLLVVLLCLVIYYVRQNSEGFQNEQCTVYAFVADWCPHCKTAKPVINNLKNNAPSNVNVEIVNEKDSNSRELMKKFNVKGFPTILLLKADGTVVEFSQRVSEDNLNVFVANNATGGNANAVVGNANAVVGNANNAVVGNANANGNVSE
jgi:thiol-disulfide isomerase/thioredoxin